MSNKVIVNGVDMIELIERDKPMKVITTFDRHGQHQKSCSKCYGNVYFDKNYCGTCGQRLMWGNENE